jgi:hypothetical protein
MESKPIINIYGNVSLKKVKKEMIKSYDQKSVRYLKYKKLYNNDFNKHFNQWYSEDLKYIILKMNNDKMHKIEAIMKSLISDSFCYIKNNNMIELTPRLKFIIISNKPMMMDLSMQSRCQVIAI